jgi:superfamily I DNA/RNA helicase
MIARGPNDLFFVGDGHQRIYSRHRAAMSKCGIDIRGRSHKLYLNYRTTDEIRRRAVALLEGCEVDDLDDGNDEAQRYKSLSHGPAPTEVAADGLEAAASHAIEFITQLKTSGVNEYTFSTCIIAPSEKTRDAMTTQLQAAGFRCVTISAQSNYWDMPDTVHVATMHRAKGLEFDAVVLVAPVSYLAAAEDTQNQRMLIYVALTRAKRAAMLIRLGPSAAA